MKVTSLHTYTICISTFSPSRPRGPIPLTQCGQKLEISSRDTGQQIRFAGQPEHTAQCELSNQGPGQLLPSISLCPEISPTAYRNGLIWPLTLSYTTFYFHGILFRPWAHRLNSRWKWYENFSNRLKLALKFTICFRILFLLRTLRPGKNLANSLKKTFIRTSTV